MRVESQRDAGGCREWADGVPEVGLRGLVRAYTGYREVSGGPVRRRETPACVVPLIIGFGPEFRVRTDAAGEFRGYDSFVAGLADRPIWTGHDGAQLGIQVLLEPLGAYSLFGIPLDELGNRVVSLSDLLGEDARRWVERLAAAGAWPERFALLDRLLAARIGAGPVPSPEVVRVWRAMLRARGSVRVGDLAETAGWSHRHLVSKFRAQVGTTPKTAARILRYERAARLLTGGGGTTVAAVAAVCGYADQSHLTREFRRFAGVAPGALVRH